MKSLISDITYNIGTGILAIYFIPSFVAECRDVWDDYSIYGFFLLNLAFGWTGIGWIVLLIWALLARPSRPSKRTYIYQELPYKVVKTFEDK